MYSRLSISSRRHRPRRRIKTRKLEPMSKTGDWFLKMQEDAQRLDLASWIDIHGESNKWVFEKANEDTPEEITK